MLEELHVSHQSHVLFFNIDHLIADDLRVSLWGFVQAELEDLDLKFYIVDSFLARKFVFFNPFLELGNIFGLNKSFEREFFKIVYIFD